MKPFLTSFFALITILLISSCSDFTAAKPAAEKAVDEFHQLFNAGNFEGIYSNADERFRASGNKDDYIKFMRAVKKKLGSVVSSEETNWKIRNFNLSTTAILTRKTKFTNGEGIETFVFAIKHEKASLMGYNINSRELIMN